MIEEIKAKIESAITECDSHVSRCNKARAALSELFPLTRARFQNLSDESVALIDQLIYRFTKLQDSMGLRLLPSIISLVDNDFSPKPFIDILNRLEQLEIIPSAADWQFFRNLRNNLAHDYPESLDQTIDTLNVLMSEWIKIERIHATAKEYYQNKFKNTRRV